MYVLVLVCAFFCAPAHNSYAFDCTLALANKDAHSCRAHIVVIHPIRSSSAPNTLRRECAVFVKVVCIGFFSPPHSEVKNDCVGSLDWFRSMPLRADTEFTSGNGSRNYAPIGTSVRTRPRANRRPESRARMCRPLKRPRPRNLIISHRTYTYVPFLRRVYF